MAVAKIFSLAWGNIDERMVRAQRDVFTKLNLELNQQIITGFSHGEWMDWVVSYYPADVYIFFDVDAIPLCREVVETAAHEAWSNGVLYGAAHACNSKQFQDSHLYASPGFMVFSRPLFERVGRPSFRSSLAADVAENMTYACEAYGRPVKLLFPSHVAYPKWQLADRGMFGIGTTYEDKVFHLFESRKSIAIDLFLDAARKVLLT